jgi:uncharacterized protein (DUF58 family)
VIAQPEPRRPARVTLHLAPAGRVALPIAAALAGAGWLVGGTAALLGTTALALVLLAPLLAWLHTRGTRLAPPAPASALAGEAFTIELEMRNAGRLRLRDAVVSFGAASARHDRPAGLLPRLAAGASERVQAVHRVARRGRQRELEVGVASSYPLGLIECRATFHLPADLLVLPRPGHLHDLRRLPATGPHVMDRRRNVARAEEELWAVREWREGESLRRVHWRLSARRERTILRELRAPSEPPLHLVLVTEVAGATPAKRRHPGFETAVALSATLLEHWLRRGRTVRLSVGDHAQGVRARGRRGLFDLLRVLAEVEAQDGDPHAAIATLPRAAHEVTVVVHVGGRRGARRAPERHGELWLLDVDDPATGRLFQRGHAFGSRPPVVAPEAVV